MKPEQPEILHEGSEEIEKFEKSLPNDVKELIEMRRVLMGQMKAAHDETESLEVLHFLVVKARVIKQKLIELGEQVD